MQLINNLHIKSWPHLLIIVFANLTMASIGHAYYTVQESGTLLKPEQKQASAQLQFITSGDDGLNFIGRIDAGFDEETNIRLEGGAGTTDFFIGGYFKWVPYPDFEKQPAIGITFGAQYAHFERENEVAIRAIPFVSKTFYSDHGEYEPYAALPFAFSNYGEGNTIPVQFTIGSHYKHPDFEYCDFTFELGFDVSESFTYVSLGAVFPAFE